MTITSRPIQVDIPKVEIPMPATSASPIPSGSVSSLLSPSDTFAHRHIGPSEAALAEMLDATGFASLDAIAEATVPAAIRMTRPLNLVGLGSEALGEFETLHRLKGIADQNVVARSFIGMGYSDTITPPVILRNIIENPGWYTQYTPYQAEISQGRL